MHDLIRIKHTFDLGMNKSLARDTIELLKKEKCGNNLLSLSLTCYLNDTPGPLTDYELFRACMIFLSDPKAHIDDIVYCCTNGRLEESKKKEMEYFISGYCEYKRNCLAIDNKIQRLKEDLKQLDREKAPGVKTIKYDGVRLENAKSNMEKKLINYISEKDRYTDRIEAYERLKTELTQEGDELQALLKSQNLCSITDIKKNFDEVKKVLKSK